MRPSPILVAALIVSPCVAEADEPSTPAPAAAAVEGAPARPTQAGPAEPTRSGIRFYGWQNIIVGEGAVGIGALGWWLHSAPLATVGGVVYVLGGPAVHGIHGNIKKAIGSLAIEVGLPLTGLGLGAGLAAAQHANTRYWGLFGLATGFVAAPLLDGLALGFEHTKPPGPQPPRARAVPIVAVTPGPDARGGSFVIGAAGVF